MPRNSVKTTYRKAAVSPSERDPVHPAYLPELRAPTGLSPLATYLTENEDSGLSVLELIEQFQEYDCDHVDESVTARSSTKITFVCPACGRVRYAKKPGVN